MTDRLRLHLEPERRTDDGTVGLPEAEHFTDDHPHLVAAARIGWAAKGVVYGLVGLLALLLAVRPFDSSMPIAASQTGAVATVARQPAGALLLLVLAAGLVIFAAWRVVSIVLPAATDSHTWLTRAAFAVSGSVYLVLAWTAVSFALESGDATMPEESHAETFCRTLMAHPGGRWLVGVLGAGLLVTAGVFVHRSATATFAGQLRPEDVGPLSHRGLVLLGQIGWLGRAAMMGLIGVVLVRAAWLFDPAEAAGLDGALREATTSVPGTVVALVVAVGLLVYGLFCVLSASHRLLVAADEC